MTPARQPGLPVVVFRGRDLTRLLRLTLTTGQPGSFSCSPDGTVWAGHSKGLHQPQQRFTVTGQVPALDQLVSLYLRDRPEGGRFILGGGVVRRPADGLPFARVQQT